MGPMANKIIDVARANSGWGFEQLAAYCGSTRGAVKVVLCCARRDKIIGSRPGDGHRGRSIAWLPDERLADYRALRAKVGAAEAGRMIRDEMARDRAAEQVRGAAT